MTGFTKNVKFCFRNLSVLFFSKFVFFVDTITHEPTTPSFIKFCMNIHLDHPWNPMQIEGHTPRSHAFFGRTNMYLDQLQKR